MRTSFSLLAVLAVGSMACTVTTKSENTAPEPRITTDVPLTELAASYGAFSDGQKLEVFVALLVKGDKGGFGRLGDGDVVTVDVAGTTVPTRERIQDGKVHYIAELASPPDEPEVTVTVARGAEQSTAKVRIGPNFELKAPPAHVRVGDVVTLDLDPRPDLTEWASVLGPALHHEIEVYGECVDKGVQAFEVCAKDSKPGTCTIEYPLSWDTTALKLTDGSSGCSADVQVRLESPGATFEGPIKGSFEGLQHRKFHVAIMR